MTYNGINLASATSDAADRFLVVGEPLASLQASCGGELPGTIAIPELLELVRTARKSNLQIARMINAQDGNDTISAWVEIKPLGESLGCSIDVRTWQTTPIVLDDGIMAAQRRAIIDRHVAELNAYLDADQRLLSVHTIVDELSNVASDMQNGLGRLWTEFLAPENVSQSQTLHWRLLDGTRVIVPGSARTWRVSLIPHMLPGRAPTCFELLLLSDQPPCEWPIKVEDVVQTPRRSLVGQDIAPVLKQPIARIIANAETIRTRLAGPLPDAYADYAGEIANSGKLLLGLLDDMSDLEVVESDNFSTEPDPIELAEVARQAAGILNVRAREKSIVIELPGVEVSLPARAEFRRVLQILLNLIGNAIRYAPEKTTISIMLERRERQSCVIVSDQGPGLSEDQQLRIFNKFERLGRSGDGGSGLGLYISRRLAEAMNGTLSVQSSLGEGAQFILSVPSEVAE